ncbi:helix-turn-helix transcriptional regulator [Candidatus Formimonas warabiya]|uniref:helix-turn-helix transcriptional regulator n=1 Tax=Formimonas warabiya TaxID=1761012 RepID=UPI0011D11554|nr:helix-turn-helix transcriptional regulator [Candidatus Formimonas warabiya]
MSEAFAADEIKEAVENNTKDIESMIAEKISKTMVGRSRETGLFKKQFSHVLEGGMGLTVVSGRPGIGKSFFVERSAALFTVGSATYVRGKFRQYDQSPLIAFSEIIEQIVRHILTLPTEALKHIKNNLNQKLSADSGIILSVCPYAQILFETHKAVHADNLEKLKYRVRKAVRQLLFIVSTALFPLIIFIDDLQWADALSASIIEALCQEGGALNLYLVLAWRNHDTARTYLNPAKLPKSDDILIELGALQPEDIEQYVRLVFGDNIEHKEHLIRILFGLTLGNPFNIDRVVRLLMQQKAFTYSAPGDKWVLWHSKMEKLNLPADMEQLILRQINELDEEEKEKELLSLISCCGSTTVPLLRALTNTENDLLDFRLNKLCRNYLLIKKVPEDPVQDAPIYSFPHDIILKLAYHEMDAAERSKNHYRIAETLASLQKGTSESGTRLVIAAHFLKADRVFVSPDKVTPWVNTLYEAGIAAKTGMAPEQALRIFECCADLLYSKEPQEKSGWMLRIQLEMGECQFICGQAEEAKQRFDALMAEYPETESLIKIKRMYLRLCAQGGDFEKVMELGAELLTHLGFKLDRKHLLPDLIKSKLLFTDRKISRLTSASAITEIRQLYILETLTVMALAANRTDDRLSAIFALKLAVLSARYGNSDYAPAAYAAYCYILFSVLRKPEKGRRLEKVVLELIEKCGNSDSKSTAWFLLGAFTYHLTNSLEDTLECLKKSVEEGEKEGGSLYGSYACAFMIMTKYMTGRPLGELQQIIDDYRRLPKRPDYNVVLSLCDIYGGQINQLKNGVLPPREAPYEEERESGDKDLFELTIMLVGIIIELERLYLAGKIEEAYGLTVSIASVMTSFLGFILDVAYIFYNILTRLAMHRYLSGKEQRRNKKIIKKHLKELKYCVGIYQGNHYARYLLAQAEYDTVFMQEKASDKPYREAIVFARQQGNLSLEALANLLAARYHHEDDRLSEFYASEAVRLYKKWGADHIGELILREMKLSCGEAAAAKEPALQPAKTEGIENKSHDLLFHLGEIEKMSGDEGYLYLLRVLIEQMAVDYCAVFFEKSDEMFLKYDQRKGEAARAHPEGVNLNHLGGLPRKLIRYVARTETEVLWDKKSAGGIAWNDPYLADKENFSLACLPVRYSGVFIGIIYLEKSSRDGLGDGLLPFVKGFVPSLLSRQTKIRETNIPSVLKPQLENSTFTERELEVLRLLAAGMSNAEISKELYITLGTVKNHLSHIYAKLDTDNRVRTVMRAKELKIIPT